MTVCLVSIAIGEKYLNEYNRLFAQVRKHMLANMDTTFEF